jgi:hypothetical protein
MRVRLEMQVRHSSSRIPIGYVDPTAFVLRHLNHLEFQTRHNKYECSGTGRNKATHWGYRPDAPGPAHGIGAADPNVPRSGNTTVAWG